MLDLNKTFIVAEAGTCHATPYQNQRVTFALKYVEAAKEAGANAVKFQMFNNPGPETMFCWMDGDEHRVRRWQSSVIPFDGWWAIKEFAEGRTTFIVAHRLSTIRFAHRIVVMDAGRIIDVGAHDELLERCAFYRALCETQLVA